MLTELLVLVLGIPVGLLLAYLSRDELVVGRKWLRIVVGVGVVGGLVSLEYGDVQFAVALGFVGVMALVSLFVSGRKV
jgi:hypothetical protein